MKVVVGTVILALAVAASDATVQPTVAYGYHARVGIPEASKIKQLEEQGFSSSPARIVGGQSTDISSVPYKVGLVIQILNIFTSVCGGALISSTRVLTAGHCYFDGVVYAQSFTAALGSNLLFSGGQRIRSDEAEAHPNWNPYEAASDIAVVKISAVTLSNVVQPIALPSGGELNADFVGLTGIASGYGITADGDSVTPESSLHSVAVAIVSNTQCYTVFGQWVRDTNICTSGEGGRGICDGDTGGPLAVYYNNRDVLVGVHSFRADAPCSAGYPAAYTRVSAFTSWINSV